MTQKKKGGQDIKIILVCGWDMTWTSSVLPEGHCGVIASVISANMPM